MKRKISSKVGILLRAIAVTVLFISFLSLDYAFADVLLDFQKLLDANPEIKKAGIYFKATKFDSGYLTIDIYDLIGETAEEVRKGTSLDALATLKGDRESTLLKNVSDILKKRPEVNGVSFNVPSYDPSVELKEKMEFLKDSSNEQIKVFLLDFIKRYPTSWTWPYYSLGTIAYGDDKNDEAEKYFLKVLEINPNHYQVITDLCDLYYWQDRKIDWAKTKMEEVVQFHSDFAYGLGTYGSLLLRAGDAEKAIAYLQKSLIKHKQDKKDLGIVYDSYLLSIAYAKDNNMQAAKSAISDANALQFDRSRVPQRIINRLDKLKEQASIATHTNLR